MLCDAVFKDGKVWEGFACLPEEGQKAGEDWQLVREGHFRKAFSRMGHCTISIKNAVASSENSCHRVMALCPDLCYDKEADSLSGFYIPLSGRKYSRI